MSKSWVGSVDIYAETGDDQWKIIEDRIRREIENKKVKAGDLYMMPFHFDKPFVARVEIVEMPQERLL